MTRFLASVRDPAEAALALGAGADIIDLKYPDSGALGALEAAAIKACVTAVAGRAPVSATVGDLPMDVGRVHDAVHATAGLGVDDVKLGVLPGGDPQACFARLGAYPADAGLILVFFADALPRFDPVAAALEAGARGVMLDTAGKLAGSLLDHMALGAIARFVEAARRAGLMAGVAGSLRASHVAPLLSLRPDVIGFRGALCRGGVRRSNLDPIACSRIRALIPAASQQSQFEQPSASVVC